MAYLGRVKFSDIAPNHPFARTCIILGGPPRPPEPKPVPKPKEHLPVAEHGVVASFEHQGVRFFIALDAAQWQNIRQGCTEFLRAKGERDGKPADVFWMFDDSSEPSLLVAYGVDAFRLFTGNIRDAQIEVR